MYKFLFDSFVFWAANFICLYFDPKYLWPMHIGTELEHIALHIC